MPAVWIGRSMTCNNAQDISLPPDHNKAAYARAQHHGHFLPDYTAFLVTDYSLATADLATHDLSD